MMMTIITIMMTMMIMMMMIMMIMMMMIIMMITITYTLRSPVYTQTANCYSGNCIAIGATAVFTAVQIGYSSGASCGAPSFYYKFFFFFFFIFFLFFLFLFFFFCFFVF